MMQSALLFVALVLLQGTPSGSSPTTTVEDDFSTSTMFTTEETETPSTVDLTTSVVTEEMDTTMSTSTATTDMTTMDAIWSSTLSTTDGTTEENTEVPSEEEMDAVMALTRDREGKRLDDVVFLLYTQSNYEKLPEVLNQTNLKQTNFNMSSDTIFLIHGYTGNAVADSVQMLREAFIMRKVNVVVVDWETLARGPDYSSTVKNTRIASRVLAEHLESMAKDGVPLSSIHLVGFSMGAQVAGQAGRLLKAKIGRIPRITALDPARPGFYGDGALEHLQADDAEFVLVLHTASGFVSPEEQVGHADFYPNGGRSPQPPCEGESIHLICSHMVAPRYFAESIYIENSLKGTLCGSWREYTEGRCVGEKTAYFGPDTPVDTRGTFYLRTNDKAPYGLFNSSDSTESPDNNEVLDASSRALESSTPQKNNLADRSAAVSAATLFLTATLAFLVRH